MTESIPLIIINPMAGGFKRASVADFQKVVGAALGQVEFVATERRGHATELAERAAREGRTVVVATGGDGSIHEVVGGLMRAREAGHTGTALGIIGRGTGSDFAKTLGFDGRLDRYLSVLAAGQSRPMDVGRFRYGAIGHPDAELDTGYFVNILSAGMGGLVDTYVHSMASWAGGKAGYFLASFRALMTSEVADLEAEITTAGVTRTESFRSRQLAICNGQYFGSGMHVAPMASPFDGQFEVIDLGPGSRLAYALGGSAIYSGGHLKKPDVRHFPCEKLRLTLRGDRHRDVFLLDVDGEPIGCLPLEIEVQKGALPVLAPVTG